ncbi:MAG: DUF4163 domain-containing protein, partial [Tsuneonella sp.]
RAGAAKAVKEDNDLYSYAFAYPSQVGAYPLLARKLEAEAAKAKDDLIKQSKDDRAQAKANDYPYNPHSWMEEWKVVADLPDFLSLSGDFSTYTGGAHGMYGLTSLVWDKGRNVALDGADMFASPAALEAALGPSLCDKLNAERAKKRGEAVPQTPQGEDYGFNSCQHIKDATVLVGSSNHRTFDRLTVWFGPYVAGPYAEGAYELDFPVDAKVLAAVKPEYESAFSLKK